MALVPTVHTAISRRQFCQALLAVVPEIPKEGAGILYAHFAGETGAGTHCYNWNLGNVKWFKGCPRDYVALKGVWEVVNGKHIEVPASNPSAWFQAFHSLKDGMESYVKGKQTGRYGSDRLVNGVIEVGAWYYVMAGDPEAYAKCLRDRGYYTAPLKDYMHAMRVHYDAFMKSGDFECAQRAISQTITDRESDHQV